MSEWTLGAVLNAIADAVPDRRMTVCADRSSTFAESADRTRRLANFLAAEGFGLHRERDALNRWECGQDRVALIMHNDLYPDMVIGCLKARVVPVNINHHYTPGDSRASGLRSTAGHHLSPLSGRAVRGRFVGRVAGVDRRRQGGRRTARRGPTR